ncbi:hypothetical protein KAN59_005014 [Salmonella enterica subsp. enterica serovar 4,[5],12:i:-]|nr:hypothetical protein [Salmonella enterica subsp. enterica serovar 4,[5],12:i:-]HCZ4708909.1 hypothetical protein [Salmonella enterica subsp. enterica serovar Saintpaul str. CFSAN004144]
MTEKTQNNTQDKTQDKIAEGGLRILTSGEIQLAQSVFASTIQYSSVWVHKDIL